MSAQHAPAAYAPRPVAPAAPRTQPAAASRIRLVTTPAVSRSRVPFILLCIAILATALAGVLLLNTTMAHGSYEQRSLQREISQLAQVEQALLTQIDAASSPHALAEHASRMGMVQDSTPAFVRLEDGKVIGDVTPAQAKN
ncbi:hypothetical protein IGS67_09400 [Flavimobilis sp. GY10621]|uniref:Cell division protein FtsL n=1 Tax=Flavimobilis rhizosphaerae TaxID=2775421 RepID=A0ABR9DTN7_9MICO|nr:hypothetical protein [Flavimobilis rhizosphaerae]MBD9699702.1 hypothetical protein [Flavimobilis rhizosphaerae]